jgi:fibronectin-binding autotransporter adhesin
VRLRALLALVALLGAADAAQGANFTVNNTADSGAGSLRQAITDANAATDASNTIVFSLPASSTIPLATPLPDLEPQTLVFDAASGPGITIDGAGGNPFLSNMATTTSVLMRNVSFTDGSIDFAFDQLTLESNADTTIDANLSGTGVSGDFVLHKTGAGTATISTGRTMTLAGGLSGVGQALIDQGGFVVNGTLVTDDLNASSGTTLTVGTGGAINAANTVTVNSTALIVNGALNGANGVTVNSSTFDLNGSLSGASVLIGPSTLFTGNGGSITGNTTVQGTVSPTTTAGALAVAGNLTFAPTSVLDLDLQPGPADRIQVTGGTVTVQPGARLVFRTDPTAFAAPQTFPVVTSGAPVSGAFTLGSDYAFLSETFSGCGANDVCLTLAPNGLGLSDFAATPNQQRVASQLDAASAGATGDLADALDAINRSTAAELPDLLDAIGGEPLTAFATGRQILGERTARALHRRVRDGAWGEARAFYLRPLEQPSLLDELFHVGSWLDAFGVYGRLDGNTGEAQVQTLLGGGTLGVDAWLGDRVVGGVAAGYSRIDVDLDDRVAQGYGDAIQGAMYAGYTDPRGYLSVYGRYAYTFQNSSRRIQSTELHRTANADWNAQDLGAGVEAGLTVLSIGRVGLQPIAGFDWLRLDDQSYHESGAGSLGLDVDPKTLDSRTARFGGRLFGSVDLTGTGVLVPELRAFWQKEYGDRERVLDARLLGAPQVGPSGVRGPEMPADVVILGLGWGVHLGQNLTITLDYDALLDSDRVEHQGNLAARWLF